jgi:hypothetical protein
VDTVHHTLLLWTLSTCLGADQFDIGHAASERTASLAEIVMRADSKYVDDVH